MGDSNTSSAPLNPPKPEKTKPEQKDLLSQAAADEKQEPTTLDIRSEADKRSSAEEVLAPRDSDAPKPPDLTPQEAPEASTEDRETAEPGEPEEEKVEGERYQSLGPLGGLIGKNLKDLGLGRQIALAGAALCFLASFFWSWEGTSGAVEWFVVLVMLLMSAETIALIVLQIPDRFSEWRDTLKPVVFVPGGHIVLFSLLGLLLGERSGAVLCLIGGIAICLGNYIAVAKARPSKVSE